MTQSQKCLARAINPWKILPVDKPAADRADVYEVPRSGKRRELRRPDAFDKQLETHRHYRTKTGGSVTQKSP